MQPTKRLICFLVLLLMAACNPAINTVTGSGILKTETRTISDFSRVVIAGSGVVAITQGDEVALTIEADDNLLDLLTSEVNGDTLTLNVKPNTSFGRVTRMLFTLTVKELDSLELSGSASITVRDLTTHDFNLNLSGSGTIKITGTTDTQTVIIGGSGNFAGSEFTSHTTTVSIPGSGVAWVNVSDKLDASISGSGTIIYSGAAEVTQTVTGSGTIQKAQP